MATVSGILFFIFGAGIGSFLNVLILRYDPDRSLFDFKKLGGRSKCPGCRKTLSALELIPIMSFLFLRGKCRGCRGRISFQYPIVELLSGLIFLALPIFLTKFYGFDTVAFFSFLAPLWQYALIGVWILAFLALIVVSAIDIREGIIPDELNIFIALLGLALAVVLSSHTGEIFPFSGNFIRHYALLFSAPENIYLSRVLGALVAGVLFLSLVYVTRGRGMGMGDVKFMTAAGFLLGWPDIAIGTLLGFIIGGLGGTLLYFAKRRGMKDKIPFGPFLAVGLMLAVFVGFPLIDFYFSILG